MMDLHDSRKVTTRKPHHCEYCGSVIPRGSFVEYEKGEEIRSMTSLDNVSTKAIVAELRTREGVEVSTLSPTMKACIQASGPATVLVIID